VIMLVNTKKIHKFANLRFPSLRMFFPSHTVLMPLLTIVRFFFSRSLKIFLFGRFSFRLTYNDTILSSTLFNRYMCGNC
jgi:hypothetical protein